MTIGFFDSGIGGLTVLNKALKRLPHENFLYMADVRHVPYGSKSEKEVRQNVLNAASLMMAEGIEALVLACNTATSIAAKDLRKRYNIPIIGMEPAVKPAVEINKGKEQRVLVLATELTLVMPKYFALISRVDKEHVVDSLSLPELVSYCEQLQFDAKIIGAYFAEKLAPFDLNRYSTIVLGCTHYPYYRGILRELLPSHIQIVDGNEGTVRRLQAELPYEKRGGGKGQVIFRTTIEQDHQYINKMKKALQFLHSSNV